MFFGEVCFCTECSNVMSSLNLSGPPLSQNYKARNIEKADTIISSVSASSCNIHTTSPFLILRGQLARFCVYMNVH